MRRAGKLLWSLLNAASVVQWLWSLGGSGVLTAAISIFLNLLFPWNVLLAISLFLVLFATIFTLLSRHLEDSHGTHWESEAPPDNQVSGSHGIRTTGHARVSDNLVIYDEGVGIGSYDGGKLSGNRVVQVDRSASNSADRSAESAQDDPPLEGQLAHLSEEGRLLALRIRGGQYSAAQGMHILEEWYVSTKRVLANAPSHLYEHLAPRLSTNSFHDGVTTDALANWTDLTAVWIAAFSETVSALAHPERRGKEIFRALVLNELVDLIQSASAMQNPPWPEHPENFGFEVNEWHKRAKALAESALPNPLAEEFLSSELPEQLRNEPPWIYGIQDQTSAELVARRDRAVHLADELVKRNWEPKRRMSSG